MILTVEETSWKNTKETREPSHKFLTKDTEPGGNATEVFSRGPVIFRLIKSSPSLAPFLIVPN